MRVVSWCGLFPVPCKMPFPSDLGTALGFNTVIGLDLVSFVIVAGRRKRHPSSSATMSLSYPTMPMLC